MVWPDGAQSRGQVRSFSQLLAQTPSPQRAHAAAATSPPNAHAALPANPELTKKAVEMPIVTVINAPNQSFDRFINFLPSLLSFTKPDSDRGVGINFLLRELNNISGTDRLAMITKCREMTVYKRVNDHYSP